MPSSGPLIVALTLSTPAGLGLPAATQRRSCGHLELNHLPGPNQKATSWGPGAKRPGQRSCPEHLTVRADIWVEQQGMPRLAQLPQPLAVPPQRSHLNGGHHSQRLIAAEPNERMKGGVSRTIHDQLGVVYQHDDGLWGVDHTMSEV